MNNNIFHEFKILFFQLFLIGLLFIAGMILWYKLRDNWLHKRSEEWYEFAKSGLGRYLSIFLIMGIVMPSVIMGYKIYYKIKIKKIHAHIAGQPVIYSYMKDTTKSGLIYYVKTKHYIPYLKNYNIHEAPDTAHKTFGTVNAKNEQKETIVKDNQVLSSLYSIKPNMPVGFYAGFVDKDSTIIKVIRFTKTLGMDDYEILYFNKENIRMDNTTPGQIKN